MLLSPPYQGVRCRFHDPVTRDDTRILEARFRFGRGNNYGTGPRALP
jgi:hypothetical protein